jgi:predicted transcriptional regulator
MKLLNIILVMLIVISQSSVYPENKEKTFSSMTTDEIQAVLKPILVEWHHLKYQIPNNEKGNQKFYSHIEKEYLKPLFKKIKNKKDLKILILTLRRCKNKESEFFKYRQQAILIEQLIVN